MEGTKFDQGKPRFDLIDPRFELSLAKVLTHGANTHGAYNWQNVSHVRFVAALGRHVNAFRRGEYYDPETGEPHVVHAAANLMFLFYFFTPRGGQHAIERLQGARFEPDMAHARATEGDKISVRCYYEKLSSLFGRSDERATRILDRCRARQSIGARVRMFFANWRKSKSASTEHNA